MCAMAEAAAEYIESDLTAVMAFLEEEEYASQGPNGRYQNFLPSVHSDLDVDDLEEEAPLLPLPPGKFVSWLFESSYYVICPFTTKKTKLLNKKERNSLVASINRKEILEHIILNVPEKLMPQIFPSRVAFWERINSSAALRDFVDSNIDRYLSLYTKHSKGRDKYASLYLDWIKAISSYTCQSELTDSAKDELKQFGTVDTTVIACILHALLEGVQLQMAKSMEDLGSANVTTSSSIPSDDTSLYRISGWALKSSLDYKRADLKSGKGNPKILRKEIDLLTALKCCKDEKQNLPIGTQLLDRGGLTYMKPELISWVFAVERSMTEYLNERGYKKFGKNIFMVTKDNVLLDNTLMDEFSRVVNRLELGADPTTIKNVHSILLHKMYNVRANEFLRSVSKAECFKQKKAVDANVGLRDTLKTFAVKKQSQT